MGKRKYAYRDKAELVAIKMYNLYGTKMAVYECPSCLDFHLTSKWTNLQHLYIEIDKAKITKASKRQRKRHNLKRNRAIKQRVLLHIFSQFDYPQFMWKSVKWLV